VNPLLEQAREDYVSDLYYISSQSDIPAEYFGVETRDGAIGEGSRWVKLSAFISRIETIRSTIDKTLSVIIDAIDPNMVYERPAIIPTPEKERTEQIVSAKDAELISHKTAIMKYNNYTEEEAVAELLLITANP